MLLMLACLAWLLFCLSRAHRDPPLLPLHCRAVSGDGGSEGGKGSAPAKTTAAAAVSKEGTGYVLMRCPETKDIETSRNKVRACVCVFVCCRVLCLS